MSQETWTLLGAGLAGSLLLMLGLWALHLRTKDAGLVDFGWALSICLLAIAYGFWGEGSVAQRVLAGAVGGAWGGRLALHILMDRILSRREDGRYRYLRSHWGDAADWHFLWFFAGQAVLAAALSIPFLAISANVTSGLVPVQLAGLAVLVVSLVGEGMADRQLARFRSDPANAGRTCRTGLWRYSRHPNYFFEWLIWCGVALLAWPAPHGPWMLLAPMAMFLFVTRVTGIPYTEAQALRTRGHDYVAYQRETNAFFPGPWRRQDVDRDPDVGARLRHSSHG